MAHSAKLNALTEGLVAGLTGSLNTNDTRKFRQTKDFALRGLRASQYGRTNQFAVHSSLDGLVEKFAILNRDDLADALSQRLKELSKISNKWTPDILSLFLQLSDRPVDKSRVEDIELLKPPEPPQPLTWAEIIADDPLDEEGIWDEVDFAAESSEDERSVKDRKKSVDTETTPPSSVDEPDVLYDAESFVVPPTADALDAIKEAQFWKSVPDPYSGGPDTEKSETLRITELQAIRETLFMLTGLPTALFGLDKETGGILPNSRYGLSHTMTATLHHLLDQFAGIGFRLNRLRLWSRGRQSVALLQTFQAAVEKLIREFNKRIAEMQKKYLIPPHGIAVSLIDVLEAVRPRADTLLKLEEMLSNSVALPERSPFVFLERLYEEVNLAQMAGEANTFASLARVFFDCLQTYLKPIRKWMERGEVALGDEIFFVGMADKSSEASSLWHDQYVLRHDDNDILHAPEFLHPAAQKIFNTGKSVVFLKELGHYDASASGMGVEPLLDFETVCGAETNVPLCSFSELFETAFEDWMRSKYNFASSILRQRLHNECGLWRSLDALEHLYFSKDGSLFQTLADTIFDKFDRKRSVWNDRFLLTDLAQSVYGTTKCIDSKKLAIRTVGTKYQRRTVKVLASISLDYILPWPIMNVIQRPSLINYQRISTFLLQTYRARYLLRAHDRQQPTSAKDSKLKHTQTYLLHRLLWFTDILHSYLTETVLAWTTAEMRKQMAEAEDIDAMSAVHATYIFNLEARCLLAKNLGPIHQAIISILDLAVLYSELHTRHTSPDSAPKIADTFSWDRRRKSAGGRRSLALQNADDDDSTDEDEGNDGYETDGELSASAKTGSYNESLPRMREQFDQLYGFVTAGLRGVSRADGEVCWEMLAERLEWEGVREG